MVDVGAGAGDGVLVVADGIGGHCTGWLGARLAVRAVVGEGGQFVGAGDGFPDDSGWAGAMQSRAAAERLYNECAADFRALPRDLEGLFAAIDRIVATIPSHARIQGPMVGCIAASIEGARVRGAHVGVGRVLVLREGATQVESIVVEHFLHLVMNRISLPVGADPAQIPHHIIYNGLGAMTEVGIDSFDLELGPGDIIFLCSHRLDVPDDELVQLARSAGALEDLARAIERRAAAAHHEARRATEVAFAIARRQA